nr:glycosyltransferase [bacterium]
MKLLFCGIASDDKRFQRILNSAQVVPFAQQKLERLMIRGLAQLPNRADIEILSILPVQRFPKYPCSVIRKEHGEIEHIPVRYLGFVNLPVLKQITTFFTFMKSVYSWAKKYPKEQKVVLLYGTNPLQTIPLLLLRSICKIKLASYVSEVDSFRLVDTSNLAARMKRKLYVSASAKATNALDAYIFVSEYMNEQINHWRKPYMVAEGMVDQCAPYALAEKKKEILYAGSLNQRYGIDKLVKAFIKMNRPPYKLVIYGNGDYVPQLQKIAESNKMIEYRGTAENSIIMQAEREAELLVNPRPSEELFTRYSFPSKTFEYMLSGTPCLITRLPGIPDAYFRYCYTFGAETVDAMASTMAAVLDTPAEERQLLAQQAYSYVLQNKNNLCQMKRIWEFLEEGAK